MRERNRSVCSPFLLFATLHSLTSPTRRPRFDPPDDIRSTLLPPSKSSSSAFIITEIHLLPEAVRKVSFGLSFADQRFALEKKREATADCHLKKKKKIGAQHREEERVGVGGEVNDT